jgi:hypothetical protein
MNEERRKNFIKFATKVIPILDELSECLAKIEKNQRSIIKTLEHSIETMEDGAKKLRNSYKL